MDRDKQSSKRGFGALSESKQAFCGWTQQLVPHLELELIQTQMAQKPMLRAEVYAHAMRASQNRKKEVRREKKV